MMAMGILSLLFATARMFAWGMEFIIGYCKDKADPFYWGSVVQNCLGTNEYYQSIPRLYW